MSQHSEHVSKQIIDLSSSTEPAFVDAFRNRVKIQTLPSIARLLSKEKRVMHTPESSCNGLLDAAASIFAMLGKLQSETTSPYEEVLRREFIEELNRFEKRALQKGYHAAYLSVCRYILSATIDDMLLHEVGFEQDAWADYALLSEETNEQSSKFYAILARSSDSPSRYIDLLELIYMSFSYGYKGHLRYELEGRQIVERITNHLYERIRQERGQVSQRLLFSTTTTIKKTAVSYNKQMPSVLFTFMLTLCMIMLIFIGLNYLMDAISNEAYRTIVPPQSSISSSSSHQ